METNECPRIGIERSASSNNRLAVLSLPNKGRGVISLVQFNPGDVIEVCPVLVISGEDSCHIDRTSLYDYYWEWKGDTVALALGYGSLYNHSETPNARVMKNYADSTMKIVSMNGIEPGEEITVHYGSVWFKLA